jgi:GMP synthase (glutamine-hydrolysing)
VDRFREYGMGDNLHFIDASDTFLQALAGVTEPERKRHIIGTTFIDVFNSEAQRLDLGEFMLGQGTIYPDTIETGGTKHADVIKTHHNRVDVVEQMIAEGKVIEPLRELYKSEVRELGKQLEISDDLLYRHPFPGPGLGIRVLCAAEGEPEGYDSEGAGAQLAPMLDPAGLRGLLLPVRSVGVKADLRSYEFPVLLHGSGAEWQTLTTLAGRICQEIPGVNRCIHNLLDEVPVSATVRPGGITRTRLDLLRELDQLVMDGLRHHGVMADIWQCPTVLVPLAINGKGSELVVVRPILSERGMTAAPAPLPEALLDELRQAVTAFPEVSGLAIDVTTKPPSTIEWE